jgi:hypothetical protein
MIPLTVQLKKRGKSNSQATLQCADGISPAPYDLALDVATDPQGITGKVETTFGNKRKSTYTIDRSVINDRIILIQPMAPAPSN